MNKTLDALLTKLNWQLNEFTLHLHAAEKQSRSLMQQIQHIEEQINQSGFHALIINPDIEINRLNFITQQQEEKEGLKITLKDHQALEQTLKDKIQRVKTELNMLEKYLDREKSIQIKQHNKAQEQAMDEWAIQGTHYEN